VTSLRGAGVARGDLVGLAVSPALGLGVATAARAWTVPPEDGASPRPGGVLAAGLAAEVGRADQVLRPRWAVWSSQTAAQLVAAGLRLATCWDIVAAHRLLFGGWRADPGWAWARARGLATEALPSGGPLDLFGMSGPDDDDDDPVAPDGHLRPEWVSGGWSDGADRLARWAEAARALAELQQAALGALADRPMAVPTARSESTAELLCAELSADGLPMDRAVAEQVLAGFIGSRPGSDAEAAAARAARDAQVLRHAPGGTVTDLRSPAGRCWPGSGSTSRTPGPGGCGSCATPIPSSPPSWSGAKRSGSPPPTGMRGWTRTWGPTAGCAAPGPGPTGPQAG
jgi:DNA polymerase-1